MPIFIASCFIVSTYVATLPISFLSVSSYITVLLTHKTLTSQNSKPFPFFPFSTKTFHPPPPPTIIHYTHYPPPPIPPSLSQPHHHLSPLLLLLLLFPCHPLPLSPISPKTFSPTFFVSQLAQSVATDYLPPQFPFPTGVTPLCPPPFDAPFFET